MDRNICDAVPFLCCKRELDVHMHMMALLKEYNANANVTVEDIIALHAEFAYIHPFQDGNVLFWSAKDRI